MLLKVDQYTFKRLQEVWRQGGMMPELELKNELGDVDQVRQQLVIKILINHWSRVPSITTSTISLAPPSIPSNPNRLKVYPLITNSATLLTNYISLFSVQTVHITCCRNFPCVHANAPPWATYIS